MILCPNFIVLRHHLRGLHDFFENPCAAITSCRAALRPDNSTVKRQIIRLSAVEASNFPGRASMVLLSAHVLDRALFSHFINCHSANAGEDVSLNQSIVHRVFRLLLVFRLLG